MADSSSNEFTNAAWDGAASRFTPEQWRASCLIDTGEGDPDSKDRYKLPVREPGGAYNRNAIRNALARIGQVQAPGAAKQAAMRRLMALRQRAGIGQ